MKLIHPISLLLVVVVAAACNQEAKKTTNNHSLTEKSIPQKDNLSITENSKCFLAVVGKDSAFLSLEKHGEQVKGTLKYQFTEKDKTDGTLEGQLDKDTLNVGYNYFSEGVKSSRNLKFLLSSDKIYEIYKNSIAKEGEGFVYHSTACKAK
ncbi:hypothetical protein N9R54_00075 [Pelobium sp.]|nr:hypothetical protein [Pelobium sp.]MDA9554603.1 hypothetical protein [Pelobium sp.]